MRNDLSSKCALIYCLDTPPHPIPIISTISCQLCNSKKQVKNHQQSMSLKCIKSSPSLLTYEYQIVYNSCFFSSVVSQLAYQNDTVSFHTTNVFFNNQQTYQSDCAAPQTEVIVLSVRPAVQLSAGLLQLEDCPLPLHYPKHCFSPAL